MLLARANSFSRGRVKSLPGFKAKGRDVIEDRERYQFREETDPYKTLFRVEKDDMDNENVHL